MTMATQHALKPAAELARINGVRFPNESEEYRRARDALLAEEIELRRHIERVAEQRRALPPGGKVTKDYRFDSEHGAVSFADLFQDKQTLAVYSYMRRPWDLNLDAGLRERDLELTPSRAGIVRAINRRRRSRQAPRLDHGGIGRCSRRVDRPSATAIEPVGGRGQ
jgi:hypothetical protein